METQGPRLADARGWDQSDRRTEQGTKICLMTQAMTHLCCRGCSPTAGSDVLYAPGTAQANLHAMRLFRAVLRLLHASAPACAGCASCVRTIDATYAKRAPVCGVFRRRQDGRAK